MKPAEYSTALRTARLLRDAGVDTRVVEFEQPTRTSAEAAAATGLVACADGRRMDRHQAVISCDRRWRFAKADRATPPRLDSTMSGW